MIQTRNGNSKNVNVTAFKEQLSITLFSNLVFKHGNIRLLIDLQYFKSCCLFRIMQSNVAYVNVDYKITCKFYGSLLNMKLFLCLSFTS